MPWQPTISTNMYESESKYSGKNFTLQFNNHLNEGEISIKAKIKLIYSFTH